MFSNFQFNGIKPRQQLRSLINISPRMNSATSAVSQEIQKELGINVVQHDCARLRFAPSPTGRFGEVLGRFLVSEMC